jgi:hypothetical protein
MYKILGSSDPLDILPDSCSTDQGVEADSEQRWMFLEWWWLSSHLWGRQVGWRMFIFRG